MKLSQVALIAGLAAAGGTSANADVSVRFSTGHQHPHRYYSNHYARRPVVYVSPYAYYRPYRPYRYVAVSPIIVTTPEPVYAPAPAPSATDYGQQVANFRERLGRLRAIVEKQKQKGSFSQDSYDRFMATLNGIEHDHQARSYDRGGYLRPEDYAEFFRRLEETDADIERALVAA